MSTYISKEVQETQDRKDDGNEGFSRRQGVS